MKSKVVHFDFIEVMACPAGCINGGGQPRATHDEREERAHALYSDDRLSEIRHSEANPQVNVAYQRIIKENSHRLLHVKYEGMKQQS